MGPITRRMIMRTVALYMIAFGIGLLPLVLGADSHLRALGQGLWLPGGGFIANGGPGALLFPVTLVVFALAAFFWFGAGMVIVPAIVWLAAAALAAWMAPSETWTYGPLLNVAIVGAFLLWRASAHAKNRRAGEQVFKRRSEALPGLLSAARENSVPPPDHSQRELSLEELAALRYALDRALQPIESWNGFERIDEFQSAARRYQINGLSYALSLSQTHYTPSFHGYLSQAQRNLIDRYRLPEVWRYWIYETVGGHLNFTNFDPAAKDNIMLTAFYSQMISLYASASGDRRYEAPGSLPFRLNSRVTYEHDVHSIVRSLLSNFNASPFCLYPCEPNWVYPICNHYGMSSLKIYDRLYGTKHADELLPSWLHGVENEFTDASGAVIGVRSSYTGFEFKFPSGDLGLSAITHGFLPQRAERMWATARGDLQQMMSTDEDGRACMRTVGPGFDGGSYRTGHGRSMATIAYIAREFGDEAIAEAAFNTLDKVGGRRDDNGVLRFTEMSNLGNGMAVQAKITRRGFLADAIAKGPPEHIYKAPILAEADYPSVQVARAYSNGDDLELVLYPGGGAREQKIGFARLRPGRVYAVAGEIDRKLVADSEGRAYLNVSLAGRTQIHLKPVS